MFKSKNKIQDLFCALLYELMTAKTRMTEFELNTKSLPTDA